MLTNTSFRVSTAGARSLPTNVFDVLTDIRQEWEAVTNGESLVHYEGSVGLLLFDIVTKLDISAEEQRRILGPVLFDEAMKFAVRQS